MQYYLCLYQFLHSMLKLLSLLCSVITQTSIFMHMNVQEAYQGMPPYRDFLIPADFHFCFMNGNTKLALNIQVIFYGLS